MYRKNVAGQFLCVQLLLTASGAVATGLTPTARRCIDGTFAAGGGTFTEDGSTGSYKYAMSQADTNGNNISIIVSGTGAIPVCINFITTAADPTNATTFGLTNLDAAISTRASQTSVDTVDDFLDTEITDIRNRLPAALVGGRMDSSVGAMAANVMTAAAAAADLTTELQTGLATQASVDDLPTNAELATALGTADDAVLTQIAAVKTQTDKLTFTVANQIDANIQYVNDVQVTGNGQTGTEWGP